MASKAASSPHLHGAGHAQAAQRVGLELGLHRRFVVKLQGTGKADARVGNQDIQAAAGQALGRSDAGDDLVGPDHVNLHQVQPPREVGRLSLQGDSLGAPAALQVAHGGDDMGAEAGQVQGGEPPEARAGAGDQHRPALQRPGGQDLGRKGGRGGGGQGRGGEQGAAAGVAGSGHGLPPGSVDRR